MPTRLVPSKPSLAPLEIPGPLPAGEGSLVNAARYQNLVSTMIVNERPRGSATRGSQLLPAPVLLS